MTNSLVVSIENDVKDEIRRQKAEKRGFKETEVLNEDKPDLSVNPIFGTRLKDPLDELIESEETEQFLEMLSSVEREIIQLQIEGYKQKEIADMFNRSQGWVSNKLKTIEKKLIQYCAEQRN